MHGDTIIVLIVLAVAVALNPRAEALLHRLATASRFWRNGYTLGAAWRLSEPR